MVEIITPKIAPTVRPAGQVSLAPARDLKAAGAAMQGVADKFSAYYEEKASEEAELIWTQAQVDIARSFKEGSKTAGNGFTGATLKEYDAYVERTMQTVPLRQVDNMNHNFAKYRIQLEAKALEREAAARAAARAAAQAKIAENRGHAMLEDPTFENYQRLSDGLPEGERKRLFGIWSSTVMLEGDRFAHESLKGLVEDADTFKGIMSPAEEIKFRKSMKSAENRFAVEDEQATKKMLSDALAVAAHTGEADTSVVEDFIAESYMDEATQSEYTKQLEETIPFAEATFDIRSQPISESKTYLEGITAEANTAEEFKRVGMYQAALTTHMEALDKDAAGYVHALDPRMADMLADMDKIVDPAAKQAALEAYSAGMDLKYTELGIAEDAPRPLLPNGRAEAIVEDFNTKENGLTGLEASAFVESWGAEKKRVMQELLSADLSPFVAAQIWRSEDNLVVDMIARAKNADRQTVADSYNAAMGSKSESTDLRTEIFNGTEEYAEAFMAGRGPDAGRFIRSLQDTAFATYMTHKVENGDMTVEAFLGRMFAEPIVVSDHAALIVPAGTDTAVVASKTNRLIADASDALVPFISEETRNAVSSFMNQDVDDEVMAIILHSQGRFILNDTGDGVELSANLHGVSVPLGVEFSFTDLKALYPHMPIAPEEKLPPALVRTPTKSLSQQLFSNE